MPTRLRKAIVVAIAVQCASPSVAWDNPVVAPWQPFTPDVLSSSDRRAELIRMLAAHGLERCGPVAISALSDSLNSYLPLLIESQRVDVGLPPSVIEFVHEHGSRNQQVELARALSSWQDPPTRAPAVRGIRIEGPDSLVRHDARNAQNWASYWRELLADGGGRESNSQGPTAEGLHFAFEYVRIVVEPQHFSVNGTYRFSGDADTPEQSLHYPFPIDWSTESLPECTM